MHNGRKSESEWARDLATYYMELSSHNSQFTVHGKTSWNFITVKLVRTPYDVASGGASGTKFCMAVNWKNAGSAVKQQLAPDSNLALLLQLTQQKSYLHAGANNARLVKIGENESAFD